MKSIKNKSKKILMTVLELVIAAAIIFYLVLMPVKITSHLERNAYNKILKPDMPEETFILTIWHIVDFKPYTGSLGSFFNAYCVDFEKVNNGIFAESTAMTLEEYNERTARGESADIYSFPLSIMNDMDLLCYEAGEHEFLFDTEEYGIVNGERSAIPYALSGSFLVGNSELMQKNNIDFTADNIESLSVSAGDNESFLEKKESLTVMDAGTLGATERKYEAGKGFRIEALPLESSARLIQLIGISEKIADEKKEAAVSYVEGICESKRIEKLCALGMIPTVECEEAKIEFQCNYIRAYYEMITQKQN